jgi:hypothetical protein
VLSTEIFLIMKKLVLISFAIIVFFVDLKAQSYKGVRSLEEFTEQIPILKEKFNIPEENLNKFGESIFFAENGESLGENHNYIKPFLSPEQFVDFYIEVFKFIPFYEENKDPFFSEVKKYSDKLAESSIEGRPCVDYTQVAVECSKPHGVKGYGCNRGDGSCRAVGCSYAKSSIDNKVITYIKWKK